MPFEGNGNNTIIIGPLFPKFEIYDDVSGIDKVQYFLNNRLIDEDHVPPYMCIINKLHIGKECSFYVRVYDKAGRKTDSEPIQFTQYSIGFLRDLF